MAVTHLFTFGLLTTTFRDELRPLAHGSHIGGWKPGGRPNSGKEFFLERKALHKLP